jgi:hypothetical protein
MDNERTRGSDVGTIVAMIVRSHILLRGRASRNSESHLPPGFEHIDVRVLRWIANYAAQCPRH